MKSVSAAEMRDIDAKAIHEFGIPGIVLMENAGRILAEAAESLLEEQIPHKPYYRFALLCGPGNNGGDGLVAARYLYNQGHDVHVFLVKPPDAFKGDPLTNYRILNKMGLSVTEFTPSVSFNGYNALIDALLGTGTKGEIKDIFRTAIETANAAHLPVIAADIPSGLDADTGFILGTAVRASLTVTMGLPKKGLLQESAGPYVGKLIVADIGLPRSLLA